MQVAEAKQRSEEAVRRAKDRDRGGSGHGARESDRTSAGLAEEIVAMISTGGQGLRNEAILAEFSRCPPPRYAPRETKRRRIDNDRLEVGEFRDSGDRAGISDREISCRRCSAADRRNSKRHRRGAGHEAWTRKSARRRWMRGCRRSGKRSKNSAAQCRAEMQQESRASRKRRAAAEKLLKHNGA